jgi:hypothetical protein
MTDESDLAPSQREWCRKANVVAGCDDGQRQLLGGLDDGRLGNGA